MSEPYYSDAKKAWLVYVPTPTGGRLRKVLASGPKAKSRSRAFDAWKEWLSSSGELKSPDPKFAVIAAQWLQRQIARHAKGDVTGAWLARVTATLERFGKRYPEIRASQITEAVATEWLGPTAKASYEKCEISVLKAVLRSASVDSPVLRMRLCRGGRREFLLTEEAYRKLLDGCCTKGLKSLLKVMWNTGARPSELRVLRWKDIDEDLSRAVLHVHKNAKKSNRPRIIYFNQEARAELSSIARTSEFVFVGRGKQPYSKDSLVRTVGRLQKRTGIPASAYSFRHAFITRALKSGLDAAVTAELTGTSITMIELHYSHLSKQTDHLRLAAERL